MIRWDSQWAHVFVCMCVRVQNLSHSLASKKNKNKATAPAELGPSTGLAGLEPPRQWLLPGLGRNSGYILMHMGK